ncbi:MAG: hypothetical protein QNK37_30655 [Acidobacteriota bacterium]|nr:hypothetical protein [Acidobacteriota bacterium]
MNNRAQLIVIKRGNWNLYESLWSADVLPYELFWGPEHATTFIESQHGVTRDAWLRPSLVTGGALLDLDTRELIFFGNSRNLRCDIPLRRTFFKLMQPHWQNWTLRWAHEGLADFADHVGYPRERIIDGHVDRPHLDLSSTHLLGWVDLVGSIKEEDGRMRIFPLDGHAEPLLIAGPRLLYEARRRGGERKLDLQEHTDCFPLEGFHLDVASRTLTFWTGPEAPGLRERIAERWPDWSVVWARDRYETQLDAADGTLHLPERTEMDMIEQLEGYLLAGNMREGLTNLNRRQLAELDCPELSQEERCRRYYPENKLKTA